MPLFLLIVKLVWWFDIIKINPAMGIKWIIVKKIWFATLSRVHSSN